MGKLSIGKHESFEGEFVGGQPRGRGKYKDHSGWTFEGAFIGLRPAGGSHVYKATHKGKDGALDVYEGQINPHDCAFHGAGRLISRSAVPGMVVHYEGAFQQNEPQSPYARLWYVVPACVYACLSVLLATTKHHCSCNSCTLSDRTVLSVHCWLLLPPPQDVPRRRGEKWRPPLPGVDDGQGGYVQGR